jgi:hypothetical protein
MERRGEERPEPCGYWLIFLSYRMEEIGKELKELKELKVRGWLQFCPVPILRQDQSYLSSMVGTGER